MIRAHKPVRKAPLPPHYAAFDCETEGLHGAAKLICVKFNTGEKMIFKGDKCAEEFVAEVTRPKYRNYVFFAHNLSFDLQKTFGSVYGNTLDNEQFNIVLSGSKMIKATYKVFKDNNDRHTITFLDTLNLMPYSLRKIGEDLGFNKLETPEKWITGEPVTDITDNDIEYCFRDCDVVLRILDVFSELLTPYKITLKVTIGACAKAVWKSIELSDGGMFLDEKKDERFREGYYGGRTEVFRRGYYEDKLYYYDVNSLYPSVMVDNQFPNPDKLRYTRDLMAVVYKEEGCARCTVEAPDMNYPVLPVKHNDKLIFPVGTFTGTWCFPELRLAIEKGYKIVKVVWVLSSPPIPSPFKEYIEHFRKLKIQYTREGKTALRNTIKLFLNSLYGKFAQRVPVEDQYVHEKPEGRLYSKQGNNTYKLCNVEKDRGHETVVGFAAYTTSYSRVALYRYFPDKGLVYCDTDSVVRDTALPDEVVDSSEFGLMDLEHVIDKSNFVAPKRYKIIDEKGEMVTRMKGVPQAAINLLDIKNFDVDHGVVFTKPVPHKTALSRGVAPYSEEMCRKTIRKDDLKRTFNADGSSVPIRLCETC